MVWIGKFKGARSMLSKFDDGVTKLRRRYSYEDGKIGNAESRVFGFLYAITMITNALSILMGLMMMMMQFPGQLDFANKFSSWLGYQ